MLAIKDNLLENPSEGTIMLVWWTLVLLPFATSLRISVSYLEHIVTDRRSLILEDDIYEAEGIDGIYTASLVIVIGVVDLEAVAAAATIPAIDKDYRGVMSLIWLAAAWIGID